MNLAKIFTWILTGLAFILPLFFLPLTTEFYVYNKTVLLVFSTAILLLVWGMKIFFAKSVSWQKTSLNFPILGLMAVFLLSTFIQSPNHLTALFSQTAIILSLGLLYFIIVNNLNEHQEAKKAASFILIGLIASSVVLAWLTVFAYLGLNQNFGLEWLKTKLWTPSGSPINTLSFLLVLLPATLYWAFKTKSGLEKILLFLASSLQILASILIISLFVAKTAQFFYLPPQYGWQICVEGFKNLRTGLLGVGPNNFLSAFSRFRPIGLNNTGVWTVNFGSNSNEYFQLLSTVGLIGLFMYLLLILKTIKKDNFKADLLTKTIYLLLVAGFIIQLIIPANILVWLVIFLGLGLNQILKSPQPASTTNLKPVVWGTIGLMAVFSLSTLYFQGRYYLADYYFRKSLVAASQNKGIETYNLQIKALRLNPNSETYRLSYANTNFALANALASQKDLTDQDKNNVSQLISQSIREAKNLINLNPQISSYWANLAIIYRNIINVAQGADEWAVSAYSEAVRTDPTNPLLRVDFGGLYYTLTNYDLAIEQFRMAINLKPDYANAYYNLASVYKAKQDWQRAFENLSLAISFVPADSPDRQKALTELEEIRTKLPTASPAPAKQTQVKEEEKLKTPQVLPTPKPGFSNIQLPEEAKPEIPTASPSPSPSPSLEPSATPAVSATP